MYTAYRDKVKVLTRFVAVFFTAIVTLQGLAGGVLHAESMIHYRGTIATQEGYAVKYAAIDIRNYSDGQTSLYKGYADVSGHFDILVAPGQYAVQLSGLEFNGFPYAEMSAGYTTPVITQDYNDTVTLPLVTFTIASQSVAGGVVQNADVALTAQGYSGGDRVGMSRTIYFNGKTNPEGKFVTLVPTRTHMLLQITPPSSTGLENYSPNNGRQLDPILTASTHIAVLQFPAPKLPSHFTASINASGRAKVQWDAVQNAAGLYLYRASPGSNVRQRFTLPGNATLYEEGPHTQQGQYDYYLEAFNQYGYTGDTSISSSAYFDTQAPQVTIYSPVGSVNGQAQINVSVVDSTPTTATYAIDGTEIPNAQQGDRLDFTTISPGPHTFTATVTDAVGNKTVKSSNFTYNPTPAEVQAAIQRFIANGDYVGLAQYIIRYGRYFI